MNFLHQKCNKLLNKEEEYNKKIEQLNEELQKISQFVNQIANNTIVKSEHQDIVLQLKDINRCIQGQKLSILKNRQQIQEFMNNEMDVNIEHQHISRQMYAEKHENENLKQKIHDLEKQLYMDEDSSDENLTAQTESFSLDRMETIQEGVPALNLLRNSDLDLRSSLTSVDSFSRFEESHLKSLSQMRRNMSKQFDQAQNELIKINKEISFIQESFQSLHNDLNQQLDEIKQEIFEKHGDEQGEQIINIEYKNYNYLNEIVNLQQELETNQEIEEQETTNLTNKQQQLNKVAEIHKNLEKVKVYQLQQELQKLHSDMVYVSVVQTVESLELQELNKQMAASKIAHQDEMSAIKRDFDNEMVFLMEKKQQSDFLEQKYKNKMQQQIEKQEFEVKRILSDFKKTSEDEEKKNFQRFKQLLSAKQNECNELNKVLSIVEAIFEAAEESVNDLEIQIANMEQMVKQ